jgi:nucleoid-associated protein YgaU
VLGAVVGAIAGHKVQDGVSDWKDNRDEEKEKKKREEEEEKERKKREEDDRRRREEDDKRRREEDERRRREGQEQQQQHHHSAPSHHDQPRSAPSGVNYSGNFSGSSRDVRLDAHGEYMLHASCRRLDGSYQSSSISLNQLLENDGGSFRWASSSGRRDNNQQRSVTVQPGDTLRGIAAQVGCSFDEIARHNGVQNPDLIYPGQVLQGPGGGHGGGGGGGGNFGASARDVRLVDGGRRLEGELLRDGRWSGSSVVLDERIGNDNGTLRFV